MAKTVQFTDVYQVDISIKLINGVPNSLDIIYGLVDNGGVKWTPKSFNVPYTDLSTVQKTRVDNLILSATNITKTSEGL